MKIFQYLLATVMVLMTLAGAAAFLSFDNDSCYTATYTGTQENLVDFRITNTCAGGSYIQWTNVLNISLLGNVTQDDVAIANDWAFVDSSLRPDLDDGATLGFKQHSFAVEPDIEVDGTTCGSCNVTFTKELITVEVPGFSNYSLQKRQDFTVYSDVEPEIPGLFDKDKVYQVVDLGNDSSNYSCWAMVFAQNERGQLVLVQTNPEREPRGNFLGDPDTNQPESIGYFPTKNGVAQTYFRGKELAGYTDFELVLKCTADNGGELVYEESFSTRYSPAGRDLVGRGIWLSDGDNAFYLSVWIIGGLFVLWFGGMIWRSVKP